MMSLTSAFCIKKKYKTFEESAHCISSYDEKRKKCLFEKLLFSNSFMTNVNSSVRRKERINTTK